MSAIPALAQATDDESFVDAARALGPAITEAAERIERDRLLPRELVDALFDAGLFTMLLPASLGGAELDLPTFIRAVEEIARADGSVAWCIGQANGLAAYMAYLDTAVARELFRSKRTILANGPGEGNRPGRAVEVDGGYQVTANGSLPVASAMPAGSWRSAISSMSRAANLKTHMANPRSG